MGRSTDKETGLSEHRKYRKFTAKQKLEIVLASLRGDRSVVELCREHGIAESLLRKWREQALEAAAERFESGQERTLQAEQRRRIAELERALGRKTYELERLSRKDSGGAERAVLGQCPSTDRSSGRSAIYAAAAVVCRQSLSRLWVAQTSFHSALQAVRPRRKKRSQRRVILIWPKTGSASSRRFA